MPVKHKNIKDDTGIIITGSGPVTDEEFISEMKKILTMDRERLKKYRFSIIDWTKISKPEISIKAIELVGKYCESAAIANPDLIVATVADKDIMYGFSRIGHTLMNKTGWEDRIFRSRKDAENWIKERLREKYGIDGLTFG
ncbi:MAG: hypothetical protein JW864_03035 [Spirochaetes bacterium]|nr:hypothetical protein [Spirochaetota bacterium]